MIRFFANDIEIILPDDYSIQSIEENQLITENGDYTLDIDVSLLEPQNARALKHVNRLNKIILEPDYDSYIIRNNKMIYGKIITVSNTNQTAKLQFVSGKSEVMYVTGENKKIWELNFGEESSIDFLTAFNSVKYPTWENKFICNPVKFSNLIANNYIFPTIVANNSTNPATFYLRHTDGSTSPTTFGAEIEVDAVENITMNVYLLYVINKLVELLGYTLKTNVLVADERVKREILINRTQSFKYSNALPDVTIRDFISDIEIAFNVVFNFNSDRTAEIVNTKSFVDSKPIIYDNVILDEYEKTPTEEVYRFDFTKLSYDINSGAALKFQKIESQIIDSCSFQQFTTISSLLSSLTESLKNKFNIYELTPNLRQYIYIGNPSVNIYRQIVPSTGYAAHVNKFRDYVNTSDKEIKINILPIEFAQETKKFEFIFQAGTHTYNSGYQIPVINADLYVTSNQNILEAIEDSLINIPRATKIEICLYNGLIYLPILGSVYPTYFKGKYPISFIDNLPEFWITDFDKIANESLCASQYETWISDNYSAVALYSLKLDGAAGIFEDYYKNKNVIIDTDYLYTFQMINSPSVNINTILFVEGNKYLPVKLERTISNNKSLLKGYFYRLK